jgi:D-arabinose 1-dehydrogenase-like Zn-dependent alcohol dehydrogenase
MPVRAAAMTVCEYGRVVLIGGVGMQGGDDLALPYPWIVRNNIRILGQWMYPREAATRMVGHVRAGLLKSTACTSQPSRSTTSMPRSSTPRPTAVLQADGGATVTIAMRARRTRPR